jgi:sensor domain CHASE-containing protein
MKARWKVLIAAGIFLALLAGSLLVTAHFQPDNEL